jgi:hypothetical protein
MAALESSTFDVSSTIDTETGGDLYRHTKRPEWGLAILAWDRGHTRGYQFEDGRFRKIKKGYFKLLEPVDEFDESGDIVRSSLTEAVLQADRSANRPLKQPVCAFDEQVDLFLRLYPKGFHDPEWIAEHRGEPGESALKRHRDPVVQEAAERLSAARCEELISSGRQVELADTIIEILGGTTLVAISYAKQLRRLEDEEKVQFAESVANLLHGEEHFSRRFRAHLEVMERLLGQRPSWRAATALPAIVHPDRHVSVRRSAFARQAGSIAPAAKYGRKPRVGSYRNYRRVAMGVKKRLIDAGHEPRDLLDVHDFIWATLRKSALEHLGADKDD